MEPDWRHSVGWDHSLTFATGIAVRRAGPNRAKLAMTATVLLAGYLMAFKVALLTPKQGIGGLIMPLGISYYSFKLIAYVLNVHWGKIKESRNLVEFAAYVAFFPQIVGVPDPAAGELLRPIAAGPGAAH